MTCHTILHRKVTVKDRIRLLFACSGSFSGISEINLVSLFLEHQIIDQWSQAPFKLMVTQSFLALRRLSRSWCLAEKSMRKASRRTMTVPRVAAAVIIKTITIW